MKMNDVLKKSPNTLVGRNGSLLQVTNWHDPFSQQYAEPLSSGPQRGDIVLLVATEETDENFGWIDILHAEKVCRLKIHPKYWMRHFMPWPRGGFV